MHLFAVYRILITAFCLCIPIVSYGNSETSHCRTLDQIKASGKLRIGVYNDDPYFSYIDPDTKKLAGFDAEIARAVADDVMGGPDQVEFVYIDSEGRIKALKEGKVDFVIAELSMTKRRKDFLDFSDIYYVAGQSVLVNIDSPFRNLEDLQGQTVGAVVGTTNEMNIRELLPQSRIIVFPSLKVAFQALKKRSIQGLCVDDVMLIALKTHPQRVLLDFRFVGGVLAWESYGIAVNKGCHGLLEAINAALKKIKTDGRWQQIYDTNIGPVSRVSAGPPI